MKKIFIISFLIISLVLFMGCQKETTKPDVETNPVSTDSNTDVTDTDENSVEETVVTSESSTEKTVIESWTGNGSGNYEMKLVEFPPQIDWKMDLTTLKLEVYEDNSLKLKGTIVFPEELVKEVSIGDKNSMQFVWDKLEYEFALDGQKEGDKYIIDAQRVDGKIKSKGATINVTEYTLPIILIGKSFEGSPSDNKMYFEYTEKSTPPKDLEEVTGNITIDLTKI